MGQEARTTLRDVLAGIAREQGQASLQNPHRGGTVYLVQHPRLTGDHQEVLSPQDWDELHLAVGAIVQVGPDEVVTYRLYRDDADLQADWQREEEHHQRAVRESGGRGA